MYEIAVTRVFSAAHAIRLPDGSLEPIHGHNWEIQVTVGAPRLDRIEVVMDFHELEHLVESMIAEANNRNLNDIGPFANGQLSPTAERVAWWIGTHVAKHLPTHTSLLSVRISEAPGCHATYRPQ